MPGGHRTLLPGLWGGVKGVLQGEKIECESTDWYFQMNVLFISAWYPNRRDPMEGLFVRKHAQAVSLHCNVRVLFVCADRNISSFEMVDEVVNGVNEVTIYYPASKGKISKTFNYVKAYKKGVRYIKKKGFVPHLIQANVFTRTVFVAWLYKLRYHIPYVAIEHWTRYFREKTFKNLWHKKLTVCVSKAASAILPVTKHLQSCMERHGMQNEHYVVINNVVEDAFFGNMRKPLAEKKRILNVTCFTDEQKNLTGLLRVIKRLYQKRQDFELYLVGEGQDFDKIKAYSEQLGLNEKVVFYAGLLEGMKLVEAYHRCDFSVLFSNYENIPVVISESLSCGKPVVSTDVGGISEHVNADNGVLIKKGDEEALYSALDYMLDNYQNYDSVRMQRVAEEKYSYQAVGRMLYEVYRKVIDEN